MKNFYIILFFGVLTSLSSSVFATTWEFSVYEPTQRSQQLMAQISPPTEYPVRYSAVRYVTSTTGEYYHTFKLVMWIDKDQITGKGDDGCVWTGKIDAQKTTATGTVVCQGVTIMGWDAIVYQN